MIENLASFNKLKQDIDTLECLSFMMTDEEKNELMEIKEKFEHNQKNIEEFNNHFSDNAWCTYDSISTELVECANNAYNEKGLDAGEKVLLDFYSSEVKDNISRLKVGPFKERYHLIQNAFDDHFAKRYSASVLEFLSIIDGTVNDFTKSKGFFAEGTDVTAWDCLVGCNESLSEFSK